MTDMLIRDVPDEVVAAVDARASRLGLSRSEYVRRRLAQDAASASSTVTTQDLARLAEVSPTWTTRRSCRGRGGDGLADRQVRSGPTRSQPRCGAVGGADRAGGQPLERLNVTCLWPSPMPLA